MSSLISINDVLKITTKVEKIHPYKVVGDRDSYSPYNEGWNDCVSLIESYLETIPSAEPERKWIPVTEALPEEDGRLTGYLVSIGLEVSIMCFVHGEFVSWVLPDNVFVKSEFPVSAWMPLPEVWKGE